MQFILGKGLLATWSAFAQARQGDPHGAFAETVLLHVPQNRGNLITLRQPARHIGRLNPR